MKLRLLLAAIAGAATGEAAHRAWRAHVLLQHRRRIDRFRNEVGV